MNDEIMDNSRVDQQDPSPPPVIVNFNPPLDSQLCTEPAQPAKVVLKEEAIQMKDIELTEEVSLPPLKLKGRARERIENHSCENFRENLTVEQELPNLPAFNLRNLEPPDNFSNLHPKSYPPRQISSATRSEPPGSLEIEKDEFKIPAQQDTKSEGRRGRTKNFFAMQLGDGQKQRRRKASQDQVNCSSESRSSKAIVYKSRKVYQARSQPDDDRDQGKLLYPRLSTRPENQRTCSRDSLELLGARQKAHDFQNQNSPPCRTPREPKLKELEEQKAAPAMNWFVEKPCQKEEQKIQPSTNRFLGKPLVKVDLKSSRQPLPAAAPLLNKNREAPRAKSSRPRIPAQLTLKNLPRGTSDARRLQRRQEFPKAKRFSDVRNDEAVHNEGPYKSSRDPSFTPWKPVPSFQALQLKAILPPRNPFLQEKALRQLEQRDEPRSLISPPPRVEALQLAEKVSSDEAVIEAIPNSIIPSSPRQTQDLQRRANERAKHALKRYVQPVDEYLSEPNIEVILDFLVVISSIWQAYWAAFLPEVELIIWEQDDPQFLLTLEVFVQLMNAQFYLIIIAKIWTRRCIGIRLFSRFILSLTLTIVGFTSQNQNTKVILLLHLAQLPTLNFKNWFYLGRKKASIPIRFVKAAFCYVAASLILGFLWYILIRGKDSEFSAEFNLQGHSISAKAVALKVFYFAFTTLTTVGFGDLYPVSSYERILTLLLVLAGALLSAWFIAVGLNLGSLLDCPERELQINFDSITPLLIRDYSPAQKENLLSTVLAAQAREKELLRDGKTLTRVLATSQIKLQANLFCDLNAHTDHFGYSHFFSVKYPGYDEKHMLFYEMIQIMETKLVYDEEVIIKQGSGSTREITFLQEGKTLVKRSKKNPEKRSWLYYERKSPDPLQLTQWTLTGEVEASFLIGFFELNWKKQAEFSFKVKMQRPMAEAYYIRDINWARLQRQTQARQMLYLFTARQLWAYASLIEQMKVRERSARRVNGELTLDDIVSTLEQRDCPPAEELFRKLHKKAEPEPPRRRVGSKKNHFLQKLDACIKEAELEAAERRRIQERVIKIRNEEQNLLDKKAYLASLKQRLSQLQATK